MGFSAPKGNRLRDSRCRRDAARITRRELDRTQHADTLPALFAFRPRRTENFALNSVCVHTDASMRLLETCNFSSVGQFDLLTLTSDNAAEQVMSHSAR
jgi:hypothetical protein